MFETFNVSVRNYILLARANYDFMLNPENTLHRLSETYTEEFSDVIDRLDIYNVKQAAIARGGEKLRQLLNNEYNKIQDMLANMRLEHPLTNLCTACQVAVTEANEVDTLKTLTSITLDMTDNAVTKEISNKKIVDSILNNDTKVDDATTYMASLLYRYKYIKIEPEVDNYLAELNKSIAKQFGLLLLAMEKVNDDMDLSILLDSEITLIDKPVNQFIVNSTIVSMPGTLNTVVPSTKASVADMYVTVSNDIIDRVLPIITKDADGIIESMTNVYWNIPAISDTLKRLDTFVKTQTEIPPGDDSKKLYDLKLDRFETVMSHYFKLCNNIANSYAVYADGIVIPVSNMLSYATKKLVAMTAS